MLNFNLTNGGQVSSIGIPRVIPVPVSVLFVSMANQTVHKVQLHNFTSARLAKECIHNKPCTWLA